MPKYSVILAQAWMKGLRSTQRTEQERQGQEKEYALKKNAMTF